jgi:hypothetical protein
MLCRCSHYLLLLLATHWSALVPPRSSLLTVASLPSSPVVDLYVHYILFSVQRARFSRVYTKSVVSLTIASFNLIPQSLHNEGEVFLPFAHTVSYTVV